MLEYMRKNSNSGVVWLIIGAITLVFIFFGVGGGGGSRSITVNGQDISPLEVETMVRDLSRSQSGEMDAIQERELRRGALQEVIGRTLVRQFGANIGLEPSDRAVAGRIAADERFQIDGRFDKGKYDAALKAMRTDGIRFEAQERRTLLMTSVVELVGGLARVYEPEVLEKYHFQADQVALDYAFFPSEGLKAGLAPTEDQLNNYYLRHQEDWRRKSTMKIEYVELRPADFLDQVELTDDELMTLYKDSGNRFVAEDSAEAAHILFRFPNLNPSDEEKQAVLERAQAALVRAGSEDFAALARELSEDATTAAEGGSLGQVTRGLFFKNFEDSVFSAPLNEAVGPVETSVGYHLLKVTARQTAGPRPFEEVRGLLAGERRAFKAREMAVARLEDLLVRTETNPKLSEAAKTMGLETKTTEMFTDDDPPAFFEGDQEAVKRAFQAQVGRVAFPVEKENALVAYVPLERVDSFIPPLEEINDTVVAAWVEDEALRLARLDAAHFAAQAGRDWDQALAGLPAGAQVSVGRTGLGARTALLADNPDLTRINQMEYFASVCSVAAVGQVSPLPAAGSDRDGRTGIFVLRLADFQPVDEGQLTGVLKDSLSSMLTMSKANLMFQVWQDELFKVSQDAIKVPANYLN